MVAAGFRVALLPCLPQVQEATKFFVVSCTRGNKATRTGHRPSWLTARGRLDGDTRTVITHGEFQDQLPVAEQRGGLVVTIEDSPERSSSPRTPGSGEHERKATAVGRHEAGLTQTPWLEHATFAAPVPVTRWTCFAK